MRLTFKDNISLKSQYHTHMQLHTHTHFI